MDRTFRGGLAGVIGGIAMNIWDLAFYYILDFDQFRFLDWAAMMIYGEPPVNTVETMVSLITQIIWAGFIGVIFSFLIPQITSRGYLIKGAFYGFISYFILYSIPVLFQIPHLYKTGFNTQIIHAIGAIIFGATTALALNWLETTPRIKN